MSGRLIPALLLVGLGAVVGGVVGALVAGGPRGDSVTTDPDGDAGATETRVDDVEQRLVVLEKRTSGRVRADVARDDAPASGADARPAIDMWR